MIKEQVFLARNIQISDQDLLRHRFPAGWFPVPLRAGNTLERPKKNNYAIRLPHAPLPCGVLLRDSDSFE